MESSKLFSGLLDSIPYFIYIAAFNDFLIAVFLILRIFQKIVAWWAMLWLLAVIVVHISVFSSEDFLDAIEHIGLLSMTVFLVIKFRKQTTFIPPPNSS